MAKVAQSVDIRPRKPVLTTEERQARCELLAYNLAEKQLEEGTASAQVITHFLKLSTERYKLEQEQLRQENLLTGAKVEAIRSAARTEELYSRALRAMKKYQGDEIEEDSEEDDDGY